MNFNLVNSYGQPAFYYYRNSTQSIANATVTKVQLDTKVYDTHNFFDNVTNYRFQPKIPGIYYIYGGIYSAGSRVDGTWFQWSSRIIINNTTVVSLYNRSYNHTTISRVTQRMETVYQFNGTSDYVELNTYQENNGGSINIEGGREYTFLLGFRIS